MVAFLYSYADVMAQIYQRGIIPSKVIKKKASKLNVDQFREWSSACKIVGQRTLDSVLTRYAQVVYIDYTNLKNDIKEVLMSDNDIANFMCTERQ